MNRRQAINYLSNSGFSMIQIETIARAFGTLSGEDFQELKDRYGDEVEYVVRDMISGENLRWVELPRPKRQESTTKNDLEVKHHKQNIQAYAHDFGVSEEQAETELRVTKNDLGVDCISRAEAIKCLECDFDITGKENMKTVVNYINSAHDKIVNLPRVKQEPKTGYWIEGGFDFNYWVCSECKYQPNNDYCRPSYNYCPNCGAKMAESEEDNGHDD